MKTVKILIATIAMQMISVQAFAFGTQVIISWEFPQNKERYITEFRIYQSDVSGDYYGFQPVDMPNPEDRVSYIPISDEDGCFYFVMTTYNSVYNSEGNMSNEVGFCMENGRPTFPSLPTPTIVSITVEKTEIKGDEE